MARHSKTDDKLTDAEWNQAVRNLIQAVAQVATKKRGSIAQVAKAANISESAIKQMKATGKASTVTLIRVAAHLAGLTDKQAANLIENPESLLKQVEPVSELENLFNQMRRQYSDNELAAWFKLLHSKNVVEEHLGISVSASLGKPKKNS